MSRLATNKLRGEFLKKLGDCVGKRDGGGGVGGGGVRGVYHKVI